MSPVGGALPRIIIVDPAMKQCKTTYSNPERATTAANPIRKRTERDESDKENASDHNKRAKQTCSNAKANDLIQTNEGDRWENWSTKAAEDNDHTPFWETEEEVFVPLDMDGEFELMHDLSIGASGDPLATVGTVDDFLAELPHKFPCCARFRIPTPISRWTI